MENENENEASQMNNRQVIKGLYGTAILPRISNPKIERMSFSGI